MESHGSIVRRLSELDTPALLIDKAKVHVNCMKTLADCTELGVTLRAQTKTHKTMYVCIYLYPLCVCVYVCVCVCERERERMCQ